MVLVIALYLFAISDLAIELFYMKIHLQIAHAYYSNLINENVKLNLFKITTKVQ